MQLEGSTIHHLLDPIAQAACAIWSVGVGRRQFPQALLPPHAAHEEAQGEAREIFDVALTGIANEVEAGNGQARDDQRNEYVEERGTRKELNRVGDRIRSHLYATPGLAVLLSRAPILSVGGCSPPKVRAPAPAGPSTPSTAAG